MEINSFLKTIRGQCIPNNVPIISESTQVFLNDLIIQNKPKYCLEVGSAVGYSTIFYGSLIQQRGGSIQSFEISYPSYKNALSNIKESNLHNIRIYNLDFKKLKLNSFIRNQFDFVFIDAMKKEYSLYLDKIIPYMRRNSFIVLDDVIKFKDKINLLYLFLEKNQINYQIIKLDKDDGIMLLKF